MSGTAANGTDYDSWRGSVTISAWASSVCVSVPPIDDTAVESSETVVLTLASDAAYDIGSINSAPVSIADTNLPPLPKSTLTVVATDANAAEAGRDTGTFTITRTGSTAAALTVRYTMSGTAANGTVFF